MAEVQMAVKLLAHTHLSWGFLDETLDNDGNVTDWSRWLGTSGQSVALTAIRTCYSSLRPSQILDAEADRYFCNKATDGKDGTESDRLFRHIVKSGHLSTMEHLTFTFAIEGVSRSLLAQLTRHRVGFSFSVQSQRYVKLGSTDKSGGFDYVVPESIRESGMEVVDDDGNVIGTHGERLFRRYMESAQRVYDELRAIGVPAEDARAVLPNATATNLTMTANLRALLDFYGKRRKGNGAQHEITVLAEKLREAVVAVEPWTEQFFEGA